MSNKPDLQTTGDLLALSAVLTKHGAMHRQMLLAITYLAGGDKDKAFECLNEALQFFEDASGEMDKAIERLKARLDAHQ